jgi:hypothetical protein
VSHWSDFTASSSEGVIQASVPLSRVPPPSFEGVVYRPYGGGWHNVTELTPASPHNVA